MTEAIFHRALHEVEGEVEVEVEVEGINDSHSHTHTHTHRAHPFQHPIPRNLSPPTPNQSSALLPDTEPLPFYSFFHIYGVFPSLPLCAIICFAQRSLSVLKRVLPPIEPIVLSRGYYKQWVTPTCNHRHAHCGLTQPRTGGKRVCAKGSAVVAASLLLIATVHLQ